MLALKTFIGVSPSRIQTLFHGPSPYASRGVPLSDTAVEREGAPASWRDWPSKLWRRLVGRLIVAPPPNSVQLDTVGKNWDERNLAVARLPEVVGALKEKAEFSRPLPQADRKIQSMQVLQPGGKLLLPAELSQFREAVERSLDYEKSINPAFARYYAYLFVSQGPVEAGVSQRRPNAHTDGYPRKPEERGEVDRMYLVADSLPTEFFDQPFPIPTGLDFAAIHQSFEDAADPAKIVTYPPYTITMMDSYTVHRAAKAGEPVFRTFIQVHLSARRFNSPQNTPNPVEPVGLKGRWLAYKARYDKAPSPTVSDPVSFFAELNDFGLLWWQRSHWGPRMSLGAAVASTRRIAAKYFEPAAPGAAAASAAFISRVDSPINVESPNAKRKRLARALIEASLLPAGEVAAYFDGLLAEPERSADARFRAGRGQEILASFQEEVAALLKDPGQDNVAALVLSGSYAHGSPKAESDFDFLVLTRDGSQRGVPEFLRALERLREGHGWPAWKDWARFPGQNVLGAGDPRAARFVSERPALVLSPDSALRARLSGTSGARQIWDAGRLDNLAQRLMAPLRRAGARRQIEALQ